MRSLAWLGWATLIVMVGASCGRTKPPWDLRVPPLSSVEDSEPIRWRLPPLTSTSGSLDVGPIQLEPDPDGDFAVTASVGPSFQYRGAPPFTAFDYGTSVARGWFHRIGWVEGGTNRARIERYVEVFRGSRIVSLFQRVHLGAGRNDLPGHRIIVPERLTTMLAFEGNRLVGGPRRAFTYEPSTTSKPFVVLHDASDTEGIVLFFPHRPEVRRWWIEDYVVTSSPAVSIDATGTSVDVRFGAVSVPEVVRPTFDFPIYVMPYVGTAAVALDNFRIGRRSLTMDRPPLPGEIGYWFAEVGRTDVDLGIRGDLRMLRYHPAEFASWIDATTLPYGHEGGFAWGDTTQQMKGIQTDPVAARDLRRDHAFRMLAFFLEARGRWGAPPNLAMRPGWSTQLPDPANIRDIVFCQYWEFRLREFLVLFESPYLEHDEKRRVYEELMLAKNVFDPSFGGFATATPNGGIWFDYLNVPIDTEMRWIINTHTTNTGNVANLALIARRFGDRENFSYWRELFVRALDGQSHVIAQPWIWDEDDPNQIRYSKFSSEPKGYHTFMLTAWIPNLIRAARELAPNRVAELMDLLHRLRQAKFLDEHPEDIKIADRVMRELQSTLPPEP